MPRTSLSKILSANIISSPFDEERWSLDRNRVKVGEIVHVQDTGSFYLIKDLEELDNAAGYQEIPVASVAGVSSLAGTANEISVSAATGAVTLSLPSILIITGKSVIGGAFGSVERMAIGSGLLSADALVGITNNTQGLPDNASASQYLVHIGNTDSVSPGILLDGSNAAPMIVLRRATGTVQTPSATTSGSLIGLFGFSGYGATQFASSRTAVLQATATQTWTNSAQGTKLELRVTPIGSTTLTTICTIDSTGLTVAGSITPSQTTGIIGTTTNNDASAGSVGEYLSGTRAIGSATSLSSGAIVNVTSVSLTAGDWDVGGIVKFSLTGATVDAYGAGVSTTSAALAIDDGYIQRLTTLVGRTGEDRYVTPTVRLSLAATTTVYLPAQATFGGGSVSVYGTIWARRRR